MLNKQYKGTIKTEWGRFFTAPNELFDLDMSSHAKIVYLFLCRTANNETGSSFPAQATIARKCSVSLATIKRALGELEDMDLLAVEKRPGFTDVYIIKHPGGSSQRARGVAHTELGGSSQRARGQLTQSYKQYSFNKTDPTTTDPATQTDAVGTQDLEIVVVVNMYKKTTGRDDLSPSLVADWLKKFGASTIKDSIAALQAYKRPVQNPIGFLVSQLAARSAGQWIDPGAESRQSMEADYTKTQELLAELRQQREKASMPPADWRQTILGITNP